MSKHLVDIDDELLERARNAAGTETIKATVEAGLRRLASTETVLEHLKWMRKAAPGIRKHVAAARRPRIG